jgi:sigma-E factor negative regulatory protein RseA
MEMDMSFDAERDAAALERLSALVDGELDGQAAAQTCGHWRESGEVRATWHAYQLIGDVLRSDDLAADAVRDVTFLHALRVRMQDEPVVLAPQPVLSAAPAARPAVAQFANGARSSRWSWRASSAVAAGFVAVAGVVMLTRGPIAPVDASAGARLAQNAPAAPISPVLASPVIVVGDPQAVVASGQLIRDARLDRYLAAHKQFAGSSALGVPSGFLRNATATVSER